MRTDASRVGAATSTVPPSLCGNQIDGTFVLNRRVDLHAIDATPARWRGDAGSSPLDGASAATSSPRNDLVLNCRAPDTLVDFHTGSNAIAQKCSSIARYPYLKNAWRRFTEGDATSFETVG